ncbi:hypothetical protein Tco_1218745 [Tanacetum coccineum]
MPQQQHAADVYPDVLCPPNKRYDLMDANKKVDFEQVQCPPESKILMNIIKDHPLRFSIAASSSVPWIYMAQFWHTFKEDGSKYRLTFMLDKKMLSFTLDDFRTIFHLPQATDNNHDYRVGMKIPDWMISNEMKHTKHYRMYAEVFRIDVPLTQSQPTESTQGTHRTPSVPRRSTRLTPPAPVLIVDKADEIILQYTLQVSLAEHKSREEQEARENVELVNKHLASVEIEKMVEELENVIDDSPIPRNVDQNIPGTRLEPRSDKESPEVEITNVVILVNVNEEEEEITDEVYELKRREKGKIVEESRSTPSPTPIRSPRIHTDLVSSDTEKLQELTEVMVESLPTMVDNHIKEQVKKQVPEQVKIQVQVYVAKGLLLERQQNKEETDKMIAKAMLHERRRLQAEISSQIQQVIDNNILLSFDCVCNRKQVDDYDFWTESCASDDDEIPTKKGWTYKTYWELGHEHKFITKIVARRANECIVSITESDYKNLNKNDIKDIYLLIMNDKVPDYAETESYQQKVNLTAPTISFPRIEKHKMFSIIYEPVHGIIYKNSKKEKRVMRHSEIHKFCDATLNRVLEGLKSYNNDVKYGYKQRDLTEDEVEYLKLFEEEIEVRLKYRNQMRRWEMYVNGTPRIIDP